MVLQHVMKGNDEVAGLERNKFPYWQSQTFPFPPSPNTVLLCLLCVIWSCHSLANTFETYCQHHNVKKGGVVLAQLRNGDCCPSFVRIILCCLIYDDGGVLLNICDMSDNNGLNVYIVSSTESESKHLSDMDY